MPDTVEHRVEMHRLARTRTAEGLPVWERTVDVSAVFRNDALPFPERRDAIVARLRRSQWITRRDQDGFDELGEIVENLASADDVDEFDGWWGELYDHADRDRVWIKTF